MTTVSYVDFLAQRYGKLRDTAEQVRNPLAVYL